MSTEIRLPAIKVEQPIGTFYAVSINSDLLKQVSFSSRAQYKRKDLADGIFSLVSGNQRELEEKRSKEIADYIDSDESTFPNSIILGANVDKEGSLVTEDSKRWRVESKGSFHEIVIPSIDKVATIIDGQHRLSGFDYSVRKSMDLLCSVFIDLPAPYQAYIFATININQKKVNKSLAYELYGFKLDDEPKKLWSPEKLAVYITRKLNKSSPVMKDKIKLGASVEGEEDKLGDISLSTVVDGVLKLITSNPKRDRDQLLSFKNKNGRNGLTAPTKYTPLREKYLEYDDDHIERIIFDFFEMINDKLWSSQDNNSYLIKTIGLQASFDFLRIFLINNDGEFDKEEFTRLLEKVSRIDFSEVFFTASGIGASRIRNAMLIASGYKSIEELSDHKDINGYKSILK